MSKKTLFMVGIILVILLGVVCFLIFNGKNNNPPSTSYVSWEDAITILNSGQVKQAGQLHNLGVSFLLKNGSIIKTKEPVIDEIIKEKEKCGFLCENISIATE